MKALEICGYFGRLLFIALAHYKTAYTLFIQFLPKTPQKRIAVMCGCGSPMVRENQLRKQGWLCTSCSACPSAATIANLFGKSHFHPSGHYRAVAARQQNTAWNNSLQMPGTGSFREKNESHSLSQWHKPLIQQSQLDRELQGQEGT